MLQQLRLAGSGERRAAYLLHEAKDACRLVHRRLRMLRVVQRLAENREIDGGVGERHIFDVPELVSEIVQSVFLREVGADGQAGPQPNIVLSRGARRLVFVPGMHAIVVLRGEMDRKNFWLIDLDSGRERQLTNFAANFLSGDFDISPDGREIIFDREEDNSDLVLIER